MTVPFFAEDRLADLEEHTRAILLAALEHGDLPEGAEPITEEAALALLESFWTAHRATLVESTVGFAFGLVRLGTQEREAIAAFEARIAGLSPGQLADLAEADAAASDRLRESIVDRRRQILADLETGVYAVLRGALAAGVAAVLDRAGIRTPV